MGKKKDRKRKPKKPKGCPDPKLVSGMEKIDIGLGDSLHYSKDFVEADGLYPRGTLVKAKCAEGHSLGGSPQTAARVRIRCTKQGIWKGTTNSTCEPITCPPLDVEVIGTSAGLLTVNPPSCSEVPSKVKTKCKFSCPKGYKLAGPKVARCKKSAMWSLKDNQPRCIERKRKKSKRKPKGKKDKRKRKEANNNIKDEMSDKSTQTPIEWTLSEPETTLQTTQPPTETNIIPMPPTVPHRQSPYIYCPPDVVKDLPADSPTVYVRIPQPKTNVNWYDRVKASPAWAKNLEAELGLGRTQVTFQARSATSRAVASCSFTIHVRYTIPPRVYNCPTDFNVYLEPGVKEKKVSWEEPIFADNVKITHVMASKLPGYFMREGRHDVLYQAADEDGNKARCVFTVQVIGSAHVATGEKSWVLCQVGSTGRSIKLFLSNVPRGCRRLHDNSSKPP